VQRDGMEMIGRPKTQIIMHPSTHRSLKHKIRRIDQTIEKLMEERISILKVLDRTVYGI
jgi:hypothetical protein